ncbi:hypothetical protein EV189_0209 [Motilibacter rhizosphaerae]|uniref:Uncharacterized protein n=1 Tax=Motilibacter rhizosphaerae TaxID=598652 RepID=A0A4Q7NVS1_9ACTN|nr:hypothetical protein [Motilibacter rhizosphaerae]RZS90978.1 hypothetical protein EV189_0209 [Motilibacter rhizosphaerae]
MVETRTVATARRARRSAARRRALAAGLGGLTTVAVAAPLAPAHAASTPPTARAVVAALARQGLDVRHARDEGPRTVVRGGTCVTLARLGCEQMVSTLDASVIGFRTTAQAAAYVGGADDTAARVGRVVLSYGSPARVVPSRRPAYERALRALLRETPTATDAVRITVQLAAEGLLMRHARDEGPDGVRLGAAAEIPGAVDMVATDGPAVIRFASPRAAADYVGGADDEAARVGSWVLSFGAPERVARAQQPVYVAALRRVVLR